MTGLLVIAILVLLIVGHELGHFIVAKAVGVRVVEFGIGYPPRAFKIGRWGGTEYTLNWLPFGGFVRLYGEEHEHEELSSKQKWQSMAGAPLWAQASILIAGVLMNVVLGWALLTIGFMNGLPTSVSEDTPGAHLVVNGVLLNSPAEVAGIETGDEIKSIVSERGVGVSELTPSAIIAFVEVHGGEELTLAYERDGVPNEAVMIPAHAVLSESAGRPALGVALALVSDTEVDFFTALVFGWQRTIDIFLQVGAGVIALIADAVSGKPDIAALIGPVGLVSVVDSASGYGVGQLFGIAAFISINLAIINLIPIPAFDGGRLLFVAAEGITRRRIPALVAQSLNLIGFVLIILLMVVVTYQDFGRILGS